MTETVYKFDLSYLIEQIKQQVELSQLNPKNINQLALKIKCVNDDKEKEKLMMQLLTLIYVSCSIQKKIKRAMNKAYTSYTSEEEFLSLFYLTVQKAVKEYDNSKGDFQNYVVKLIDCAFKNENKSGFLKVTGNISLDKRKNYYSDNVDDYEIGKHNTFEDSSDRAIMDDLMIKKISDMDGGDILLYKYLNTKKPHTNRQIAEHFNLSEKQVRVRLNKITKKFRSENPSFFSDYFYASDNINEVIAIQTA